MGIQTGFGNYGGQGQEVKPAVQPTVQKPYLPPRQFQAPTTTSVINRGPPPNVQVPGNLGGGGPRPDLYGGALPNHAPGPYSGPGMPPRGRLGGGAETGPMAAAVAAQRPMLQSPMLASQWGNSLQNMQSQLPQTDPGSGLAQMQQELSSRQPSPMLASQWQGGMQGMGGMNSIGQQNMGGRGGFMGDFMGGQGSGDGRRFGGQGGKARHRRPPEMQRDTGSMADSGGLFRRRY